MLVPGVIRSKSLSDLGDSGLGSVEVVEKLLDEIMTDVIAKKPVGKKSRRCHQCHTPLDEQVHAGVKYGIGVCILPHWPNCDGDIPDGLEAKRKPWAPCPDVETDLEDDSHGGSGSSDTSIDPDDAAAKERNRLLLMEKTADVRSGNTVPLTVETAAAAMEDAIANPSDILGADGAGLDTGKGDDVLQMKQTKESSDESSSSSEEELRKKRQQLKLLQLQAAEKQKEEEAAVVQARKEKKKMKRLRREQEAAELDRQSDQLRSRLSDNAAHKSTAAPPAAPSPSYGARRRTVGDQAAPTKVSAGRCSGKSLEEQVAGHEVRRQRRAAAKLTKQQQEQAAGLSMAGIRRMPDVQGEVLEMMTKLQEMIPTLAKESSANVGSGVTFQPEGVLQRRGPDVSQLGGAQHEKEARYVYVTSLGRAVPVVDTPGDLTSMVTDPVRSNLGSTARTRPTLDGFDSEECSADEACPFSPEPGKRFAWRRNSDGSKFFQPVDAQAFSSPELVKTYVLDNSTGRYECRWVPAATTNMGTMDRNQKVVRSKDKQEKVVTTPHYRDHRVRQHDTTSGAEGWKGQQHSQQRRDERQPTYVCPEVHSEKQGKESRIPDLVLYARDCPVSWTSKVTTDKLNPILWSWAYISQLLATRTGHAPVLQEGELEARLQHFLSVLEVTLQTTTQSDFASEAWQVARLYHGKVQQKVDSGEHNWVQMLQQWGAATLPHELMAARAEIQLAAIKPRNTNGGSGNGKEKVGDKNERKDVEKRFCSTWNNSETRGKCTWETEHEGEKCIFVHACSWCKGKKFKPLTHQKRFCRKRIEEEGE